MHPYCVYVFDSITANEAAVAVKKGQYDSIIQYHSSKHQQQMPNEQPIHSHPQGPPQHLQSPHIMGGPPPSSYPPQQPPHHHVSPPNAMTGGMPPSQQPPNTAMAPQMPQQQPYDTNLSPQKMKERESKLNRLTQLAAITSPNNLAPAPPPTMHQMTNSNQAQHQPSQLRPQQQPPQPTSISQTQPPQQQSTPPSQQSSQQHLDPLSSMAAMSECPNMDSYGHTIHHHPPS